MAQDYTSEIIHPSHSRHNTRMSTYKIDVPFCKSVYGQKTLSYLGPKTWNMVNPGPNKITQECEHL